MQLKKWTQCSAILRFARDNATISPLKWIQHKELPAVSFFLHDHTDFPITGFCKKKKKIISLSLPCREEVLHQWCCCQQCKQKEADCSAELSRLPVSVSIRRYHSAREQRKALASCVLVYKIISFYDKSPFPSPAPNNINVYEGKLGQAWIRISIDPVFV